MLTSVAASRAAFAKHISKVSFAGQNHYEYGSHLTESQVQGAVNHVNGVEKVHAEKPTTRPSDWLKAIHLLPEQRVHFMLQAKPFHCIPLASVKGVYQSLLATLWTADVSENALITKNA